MRLRRKQKIKKLLGQLSFIFFTLLVPFNSQAGSLFMAAKGGAWSFDVVTSGVSEATSGIGNYQLSLGMGVYKQFLVQLGVAILSSTGIGGQLGFGFDIDARYYPFSYYGYVDMSSGTAEVEVGQLWRPFVGAGFRQRQFLLVLSSQFAGVGLYAGTDYVLNRQFYLTGEVHYDMLYGQSDSTASHIGVLFGIGRQF